MMSRRRIPFRKIFASHHPVPETLPEFIWCESEADPEVLFRLLPDYGIGVVGTRTIHPIAESWIKGFHQDLARIRIPWVTISGFAAGVDTEVHEQSIAQNIPTIAILGSGFDKLYPRQNEKLYRRILESGGMILSEYPPEVAPFRGSFLRRNRLIASLSQATVIAQAPLRSGAMNTASWAFSFSRDVYAVCPFPGFRGFEGNQKLIEQQNAIPLFGARGLYHSFKMNQFGAETDSEDKEVHAPLPGSKAFRRFFEQKKSLESGVYAEEIVEIATLEGEAPGDWIEWTLEAEEKLILIKEDRRYFLNLKKEVKGPARFSATVG